VPNKRHSSSQAPNISSFQHAAPWQRQTRHISTQSPNIRGYSQCSTSAVANKKRSSTQASIIRVSCNADYRKCQIKATIQLQRQIQDFCNAAHLKCQIKDEIQHKRKIQEDF